MLIYSKIKGFISSIQYKHNKNGLKLINKKLIESKFNSLKSNISPHQKSFSSNNKNFLFNLLSHSLL